MKVPVEISTLYELCNWAIAKNPKLIEITKDSKLTKEIREFSFGSAQWRWTSYRGIRIKYLK